VLVGLVALLSGGSVGLISLKQSHETLRQQIVTSNLAAADVVAAFIWNAMDNQQTGIQSFAQRPDLLQAVIDKDFEKVTADLVEFAREDTLIDSIAVVDVGGTVRWTAFPAIRASERRQRIVTTSRVLRRPAVPTSGSRPCPARRGTR
jgi:hypothetical protein